jgi:hypothetical protein
MVWERRADVFVVKSLQVGRGEETKQVFMIMTRLDELQKTKKNDKNANAGVFFSVAGLFSMFFSFFLFGIMKRAAEIVETKDVSEANAGANAEEKNSTKEMNQRF